MAGLPASARGFELPQGPSDSISSLSWSKKALHLTVSSWDNSVRVYEVKQQDVGGQVTHATPLAITNHEWPVLCTAWSTDGRTILYGGVDGALKMWPLDAGAQVAAIGAHQAGIKEVVMIDELNLVCTASWDKTLRYWDARSPAPCAVIPLPDRCFAMDAKYPLSIVATADSQVTIFDLKMYQRALKCIPSPLKHQARCIAFKPSTRGFATGSIGGRVCIGFIDEETDKVEKFSFRCHRDNDDAYAVNSVAFHPKTHALCVTTGSDGVVSFWNVDQRTRVKYLPKAGTGIACGNFSHDGSLYAYAVSYEWSKGAEFYTAGVAKMNTVFIHVHNENDMIRVLARYPRRQ